MASLRLIWRPHILKLIEFQCHRTEALFQAGRPLIFTLPQLLRSEIHFTWQGGRRILHKIKQLNYDVLHTRPKLTKMDLPALLFRVLFHRH
jgi:phytoene/squalene synthetase